MRHKSQWDSRDLSFITDPQLIRHILEHLAAGSESLWLGEASGYRGPPETRPAKRPLMEMGTVYEPCGIAPHHFVDSTG